MNETDLISAFRTYQFSQEEHTTHTIKYALQMVVGKKNEQGAMTENNGMI